MRPAAQECVSIQAAPAPQCCKCLQFTVSSGQQCCWDTSVIPDFLSHMSPLHCFVAILTVKWKNSVLNALLSCIPAQPLDSTNNCKKEHFCAFCAFIFNILQQLREEAGINVLLQHLYVSPFSEHRVKMTRAALVSTFFLLLSESFEACCILGTFCTSYIFHFSLPISLLGEVLFIVAGFMKKK